MRFRALIVLLLTVAPLAAGCGAAAGSGPDGAAVAPAGAQLFLSVDTDFSSSQWKTAGDLVGKFPDGQKAVDFLLAQLNSNGLDFNKDIKPALGPETDVVALDLSESGSFVGLTKPDDPAKLKALLAKSDQQVVTREIDGWTAFAETAAVLDSFEQARAGGTLDGNADFQDAMSKVVDDSGLVRLYLNGTALEKRLQSQPQFPMATVLPGGKVPSVAVSATAESGGLRIEGAEKIAEAQAGFAPDEFKAGLPSEVPAGALVYLDFNNLGAGLKALRDTVGQSNPSFDRDLAQIESQIGVSLDDDVLPLFAGETAFYVRQGFLIPEVTLVTHVEDEQKAMATVDKLVGALRQYIPTAPVAKSTEIAGVQAKEVSVNPPFSLFYAAFDGHLVLTTARDGIAALRSQDDRLADDADFKKALDDAGVPDETSGFGYLNLKAGLPYALGFAGAAGGAIPSQISSNIEPLKSLVFYSSKDGNTLRFAAFLAVD